MTVRVQREPFDAGAEITQRTTDAAIGAVASFIGVMRDRNDGNAVASMTLEHYPGMTERALEEIVEQARHRWQIVDALVVHRVGEFKPTDPIVLVIVTAAHRAPAFAACEFIMDFLKTDAPFWKKEATQAGTRWVDARASDDEARERWTDAGRDKR
ncbi:MAG: molybdopterin synthase catalytic subunit MoaE [Burkholderiaceae bacterium]